jgi:transposase
LDLGLVVRRHELTDEQWQAVEPLLPVSGAKGRPRVDDRRVINGMLFKAKTGVAWRDLPERYGPWKTVYNRFWRWTRNGTLSALVGKVRVIAEAIDELDRDLAREVSVDSSIVRAHQHAAGARKTASTIIDAAGTAAIQPSSPGGGRVLRRARGAR